MRKVFKRFREELPAGLLQLDRHIAGLVEGYLHSRGIEHTRTDADRRVVFDVAADADLPAQIEDVRRFATGDARGLTDAQPLNLLHPLVRAAIENARGWSGGSVELTLPADAGNPSVSRSGSYRARAAAKAPSIPGSDIRMILRIMAPLSQLAALGWVDPIR